MNFLAHLHLAHLAQSSLLGNLLADFVRGNPDDRFSPEVVAGIYHHRRVDALTDGLPEVALARSWFRPQTQRVSPVSLDVMWDHFLSRHWAKVCPDMALADFVAFARRQIEPYAGNTPPHFIRLTHHLWRERWLERYQEMRFIADVLNGMASRRPKLEALRHSWHDLDAHYDPLEGLFWRFYPRLMAMAGQKNL